MTAYSVTLLIMAGISFGVVLIPAIKLPGLTELGLSLMGLGALTGAIKTISGDPPVPHVVGLAVVGAVFCCLGLVVYRFQQQE
jgi:hypothetical protein